MITTRSMGFLEKIAIQFQEAASDSTCVAAMIRLENPIKFEFDHLFLGKYQMCRIKLA